MVLLEFSRSRRSRRSRRFWGVAPPRAKDDMSRQLAAPAAKLSALMNKELTAKSIEQESGERKCNRVLKLGLDVHYRQVTVAMQEEGKDQSGWQNGP